MPDQCSKTTGSVRPKPPTTQSGRAELQEALQEKALARLKPAARDEAVRLGLVTNQRALKYAASNRSANLQILALRQEAKVAERRAARKKLARQAARPAPASQAAAIAVVIDERVVNARNFYLWLVAEYGDRAAAIVRAMDRVDLPTLRRVVHETDPNGMALAGSRQSLLH